MREAGGPRPPDKRVGVREDGVSGWSQPPPQGPAKEEQAEGHCPPPTHVVEMLSGFHDVRGPFVLLQFHPSLSEELPVGRKGDSRAARLGDLPDFFPLRVSFQGSRFL